MLNEIRKIKILLLLQMQAIWVLLCELPLANEAVNF